jgi:ABC-type sulfate transport system permease component
MTTNNWTFVGVAYAIVWVAIGAYWRYVHNVLARARERYERALADATGVAK